MHPLTLLMVLPNVEYFQVFATIFQFSFPILPFHFSQLTVSTWPDSDKEALALVYQVIN